MENTALKQDQLSQEAYETAKELVKLKSMVDLMKPVYDKIDKLTMKLKELVGENVPITVTFDENDNSFFHNGEINFLESQKTIVVVDNFAEKNTVFRPAGVKRFEASFDEPKKKKSKE